MMYFEPHPLNLDPPEANLEADLPPQASEHDAGVSAALTVLYSSGLVQHAAPELDRVVVERMLAAALETWAGPCANDAR